MLLGVPFEKIQKQKAVEQKHCIFDPILIKQKSILEAVDFFNFRKFVHIFLLFVYNVSNKLPPLKRILAFPTKGQI